MTPTHGRERVRTPLLGLRQRPGRLARALMRTPVAVYDRGWGRLFGHVFVLIVHEGRRTGLRRETVAMAATYDPATREVIVCSAWGPDAQWLRNLQARPALRIEIGRESYAPEQRFLTEEEGIAATRRFVAAHPWRSRLIARVLGWGDLTSATGVRAVTRSHPFVAFRPSADAPSSGAPDPAA
jgi:deazaflavin-dependent oxidoreductase (nitroreductase family)